MRGKEHRSVDVWMPTGQAQIQNSVVKLQFLRRTLPGFPAPRQGLSAQAAWSVWIYCPFPNQTHNCKQDSHDQETLWYKTTAIITKDSIPLE